MTGKTTDSEKDRIMELLNSTNRSQKEVAEKVGVSQSTVSRVKNAYNRGRNDGIQEAAERMSSFDSADETETDDDDDYWCAKCEAESGEKVTVEYMADECPKGHDLSGAWGSM